ncbi:signal peptide peptidase SppA [Sediminibacterium ginsengisoli]|uniref:Protease-4 n=1 Tax=Sediminibacterium ginsengisoli TaxID=413434 RepID=A0A1T4QES2_9BACT|nr:signal peptide peptidase SppA [Sediminibacterium ginsengisoli]SKA02001.1 protease-4 [Sediminibacterium ginsengisoli]
MKNFFKIFFASLLALVVFTVIGIFVLIGFIASATSAEKPVIGRNAVLVLNLADHFREQKQDNTIASLMGDAEADIPGLYDVVRMIYSARSDSSVKGIYVICGSDNNGFAASEELRRALLEFKRSNKFVIAYGEAISQKAYYVANAADRLYCHPQGGVEWDGFASGTLFMKGLLDKLEIKPQIFYAGKFKSATEPLREMQMTEANKLQTSVWLGDLYNEFLAAAAATRKTDTATLRALAVNGAIRTAHDALQHQLVDGLRYDDEVKSEIFRRLKLNEEAAINFVTLSDYAKAADFKKSEYSEDKVAIIYAEGDIVDGKGDENQVASNEFRNIVRKARFDKNVKAVVFRVNSPGGSALASDVIWRELALLRKEKPVVVSMGDVAASGGYYISCNADSVFAGAATITGSIGVFSIIPDFQSFFKNKLGITFDRVKTAPYADMGSSDRPLTETEKRFLQASVDSIYYTFKSRVSEGRKKDIAFIDSIAQGRVWAGRRAKDVGLVDRIGTLQDALDCAVRMAGLKEYQTREYPEKKGLLEQLVGNYKRAISKDLIRQEIGEKQFRMLKEVKNTEKMIGIPQARLPFLLGFN